jgi:hypothetical protein
MGLLSRGIQCRLRDEPSSGGPAHTSAGAAIRLREIRPVSQGLGFLKALGSEVALIS